MDTSPGMMPVAAYLVHQMNLAITEHLASLGDLLKRQLKKLSAIPFSC